MFDFSIRSRSQPLSSARVTKVTERAYRLCGGPPRHFFAEYDAITPSVQPQIANFVRDLHVLAEVGEGLILWGVQGSGKTALGAILLREAIARSHFAIHYFTRSDRLYSYMIEPSTPGPCEPFTAWEMATWAKVAIFDEIPLPDKDAREAKAFVRAVRERYDNQRSTILTTNLTPEHLNTLYPDLAGIFNEIYKFVHLDTPVNEWRL